MVRQPKPSFPPDSKLATFNKAGCDPQAGLAPQTFSTNQSSAKSGRRRQFALFALFAALQTGMAWLLLPFAYLGKVRSSSIRRQRILIVSMGGIGDNVFVLPVIRALRAKYPSHYITLIVRPYVLGFRELMPECIDQELPYAFGKSTLARLFEPFRALRFVMANRLSSHAELALIPRWGWDSWGAVFIAFFSRAKRRVTFSEHVSSEKHARNWLHDTFFTHLSFGADQKHESAHIHSLVQEHERVQVGPVAGSLHSHFRQLPPLAEECRIVIGPFAAIDRRTWPVERWSQVLQAVSQKDQKLHFTIVGSRGDQEAARKIAEASPRTDVQCGLSLAKLVDLLSEADLFVGMDSGIAHLAGAAGIPVIQICCHPLNGLPDHTNSPVRFAALAPQTAILQPQPTPGCEDACESEGACCICNLSAADITAAITANLQKIEQTKLNDLRALEPI